MSLLALIQSSINNSPTTGVFRRQALKTSELFCSTSFTAAIHTDQKIPKYSLVIKKFSFTVVSSASPSMVPPSI